MTPVLRARSAARLELLVLRVEEALAHERDDAHQRRRDSRRRRAAPGASTCSATGVRTISRPARVIGDGADLRLVTGADDVHERALSLDESRRRRREDRRDARRREPRELRRVGRMCSAPRAADGGSRSRFQRSASSVVRELGGAARCRGIEPACVAHVDQARIHGQAGAVDDDRVRPARRRRRRPRR